MVRQKKKKKKLLPSKDRPIPFIGALPKWARQHDYHLSLRNQLSSAIRPAAGS